VLNVNESTTLEILTQGLVPGSFRNSVAIESSTPADFDESDNTSSINLEVLAPQTVDVCNNPIDCNPVRACVEPLSTVNICPDYCLTGNFNIEESIDAILGTIELNNDCFLYTPFESNNDMVEEFTIEAINEENVCVSVPIEIDIKTCNEVNLAPVILNDGESYCSAPAQSIQICVEAEDAENHHLSICEIKTWFDCTIGNTEDLCFFFTPLPGSFGNAEVAVKVCGNGLPEQSTVANYTIEVSCPDPIVEADVLVVDHEQANLNGISSSYANGTVVFNPAINDKNGSDCYPDFFVNAIESEPQNGTVQLVNGLIQYRPDEDFIGSDQIIYELCNDCGNCSSGSINVEADVCSALYETCTQPTVTQNICVEFCHESAAIQMVASSSGNSAEITELVCFDYISTENNFGLDTLKISARDAVGNEETAYAYILVQDGCLNPLATNDATTTMENQLKTVSVIDNDVPNTRSFFINVIEEANFGKVFKHLNGTISYLPDYGFTGEDKFVYWLCNAYDLCSQAEVTIVVEDDPKPNIKAVPDHIVTNMNESIRINVIANDTVATGLALEVANSGSPQFGSNILYNNFISYSPSIDFIGKDHFTYTVCNNFGDCDATEVTVTVLENEVISSDGFSSFEHTTIKGVYTNNGFIYVNIASDKIQNVNYNIIDMTGRNLAFGDIQVVQGEQNFIIPYKGTAHQIVLLKIYNDKYILSKKVFVD